jgi:WD40 repeat protein
MGSFSSSSDNRRLITSGSHDNTARVWDTHIGTMITKPMEHPTAAISVALRPEGDALLFGDGAGFRARVWDLESGESLTPFLPHNGPVDSSAWDRMGGRIVVGTRGFGPYRSRPEYRKGRAYIWDIPASREPLPEWFLNFAESLGGFRFNQAGVLEDVARDTVASARDAVRDHTREVTSSTGEWMRWLSLDTKERSISPHCEVSIAAYVGSLVKEGTPASLREALLLRPGDPGITGQLGYALVTQAKPSMREMLYGGFLARRAVKLAPESAQLRGILALVVLQERFRGIRRR